MGYKRSVFLLLVSVICLADGFIPRVLYMDRECHVNATFFTSYDVRLKLTSVSSLLRRNWSCRYDIGTMNPGDELLIQFRDFYTDYSSSCHKNSLQISNGDNTPITGPICGYQTPINDYVTRGGLARFQFTTDNSIQYGHFDILITSFGTSSSNNTCHGSRFHCDNDRCVNYAVTCNGYDDCGDDSDEMRGCGLTAGAVAGIAIAVIFGVSLAIFAVIIVRRRRIRYYKFQGTVIQSPHQRPSYQTYG